MITPRFRSSIHCNTLFNPGIVFSYQLTGTGNPDSSRCPNSRDASAVPGARLHTVCSFVLQVRKQMLRDLNCLARSYGAGDMMN